MNDDFFAIKMENTLDMVPIFYKDNELSGGTKSD